MNGNEIEMSQLIKQDHLLRLPDILQTPVSRLQVYRHFIYADRFCNSSYLFGIRNLFNYSGIRSKSFVESAMAH